MYFHSGVAYPIKQIELFFSGRQISHRNKLFDLNPFIVVHIKKAGKCIPLDHFKGTSTAERKPEYLKSIVLVHHIENKEHFKLEVFNERKNDTPQLLGCCESSSTAAYDAPDRTLLLPILNILGEQAGTVVIRTDVVDMCRDEITLQISNGHDILNTRLLQAPRVFLKFHRYRQNDPQPLFVYETEHAADSAVAKWKTINLKSQRLCNGNYDSPLLVELWDSHSKDKNINLGSAELILSGLLTKGSGQNIEMKDTKGAVVGLICIQKLEMVANPSFFDYDHANVTFELGVAVDFSSSNGKPNIQESLHNVPTIDYDGRLNQYQLALISFYQIFLDGVEDRDVLALGFGGRAKNSSSNKLLENRIFPLNLDRENPYLNSIQGMLQAYQSVLGQVELEEPTHLQLIIQRAMKLASFIQSEHKDGSRYFVMNILTDFQINDLQPTINTIFNGSALPISIIFICVGIVDEKLIKQFHDAKKELENLHGLPVRDIVHIVRYNEYKYNPILLSRKVLEKLPNQYVDYMKLIGKQPLVQKQKVSLPSSQQRQEFNQKQVRHKTPKSPIIPRQASPRQASPKVNHGRKASEKMDAFAPIVQIFKKISSPKMEVKQQPIEFELKEIQFE